MGIISEIKRGVEILFAHKKRERLERAEKRQSRKEEILRLFLEEKKNLREISVIYGVTRERVRQIVWGDPRYHDNKALIRAAHYKGKTPIIGPCARCRKDFTKKSKPIKYCSVFCRTDGRFTEESTIEERQEARRIYARNKASQYYYNVLKKDPVLYRKNLDRNQKKARYYYRRREALKRNFEDPAGKLILEIAKELGNT